MPTVVRIIGAAPTYRKRLPPSGNRPAPRHRPDWQNPRRNEPRGVNTCHVRVTNSVDAPGRQDPNSVKRSRPGPHGHQKTASPTCARWYRAKGPGSGRAPLQGRRSGIAGCRAYSHSPGSHSHISRFLTYPGRNSVQSVPSCGDLAKILRTGLHPTPRWSPRRPASCLLSPADMAGRQGVGHHRARCQPVSVKAVRAAVRMSSESGASLVARARTSAPSMVQSRVMPSWSSVARNAAKSLTPSA